AVASRDFIDGTSNDSISRSPKHLASTLKECRRGDSRADVGRHRQADGFCATVMPLHADGPP
ncbi:MAG: hypothetical protein ACM3U2_13035, partial [Deltaproteobacteria bacterium]